MISVNIPVYFLAKKTVNPGDHAPIYEVLSGPDANKANMACTVRWGRCDRKKEGLDPGYSLVLLRGQWGASEVYEEEVS